MTEAPPRLHCKGMCKSYPGVRALNEVDFTVSKGSIHAVVGENGAGKSTLMKILSGAVKPDEGRITIDGNIARIHDAKSAQDHGIAIVYQELNLVEDLTAAENVLLGRWPCHGGLVDFASLREKVAKVFKRMRVSLTGTELVRDLPVAKRQLVEIAKALSLDARILILDEPSAVLTPHELESLFTIVRDLASAGVSVIYISHRLEEIFDIADTVTVLRDGHHISTRRVADVQRFRLISEMVGRDLNDEFPARKPDIGKPVLRIKGLSKRGRFHSVSLTLRGGEVFALTGLVGSGRTSLAQTIFGALPADNGEVEVGPLRGPFRKPAHAMKAGIAMLPEDRKQEGLLLHRPLRENMTMANHAAVSSMGFFRFGYEKRFAAKWLSDLQVKAPSAEVDASALSGGNQQKVLLARWMSRPHNVIILDEPTRGVDVGAKYEIYVLINRLAAEGVGVLMITSELPEAIGMADRIGVMHEGQLVGVFDNHGRDTRQSDIMELASGRNSEDQDLDSRSNESQ